MTKIKEALRKRGNRASAVFKLFNGYATHRGSQSFLSWHMEMYKFAELINWTGYNAETAAVDDIISQASSSTLHQKAIQENPSYSGAGGRGIIHYSFWFSCFPQLCTPSSEGKLPPG